VNVSLDAISRDPAPGATFAPLPAIAGDAKSYTGWSKDFVNWLFANRELKLLQSPSTGLVSRPGESERDFRVRLQQAGREKRDLALQKLKEKYAPKINSVQEKLRHAESTLQREQWDVKEQQMQSAISVGSTLLGAFVGRRSSTISQISSAARGGARVMKQQDDVARAQANVEALNNQLRELEAQFRTETETVSSTHDPLTEKMDVLIIKPKKTNITVKLVAMAWVPA
jgi:hypothetical protein